jgi:hypothetical protein
MKFGVALAAGAALLAIASCGEANKALAPITAAEVNGAGHHRSGPAARHLA